MKESILIVMPVYNSENYIESAIASIVCQTYPHWQLIVWDDGSTDRSLDITKHHAIMDSRIEVIASEHKGYSTSLKNAIDCKNLPYLAFVDSDDMLDITALEQTIQILQDNMDIGMVYTDYTNMDENGGILQLGNRCKIPYSKERLLIDFMTFHFRLIRRDLYELVGGVDVNYTTCPDYDLCLKLSEITNIHHHQVPLYWYRIHRKSITQSQTLLQIEECGILIRDALVRRGIDHICKLDIKGSIFTLVEIIV
jgi:glycosyltransferase involved in cell wall biosynthesis